MECKLEKNVIKCNCSYEPCKRKGLCCDCLSYHLKLRELPGCCFPNDLEKTHIRTFEYFADLVLRGKA